MGPAPAVRRMPTGEQAANNKYMAEIDGVAHAFGGQKRSQGTEDECLRYVMAVEAWLVRHRCEPDVERRRRDRHRVVARSVAQAAGVRVAMREATA